MNQQKYKALDVFDKHKDQMASYEIKKNGRLFGDKSNNHTIGPYKVKNYDSSWTKTKKKKSEDMSISLTRALINGHLIETIDDKRTTQKKRFSFKLSYQDQIVFNTRCKVRYFYRIKEDSAFTYDSSEEGSLLCTFQSLDDESSFEFSIELPKSTNSIQASLLPQYAFTDLNHLTTSSSQMAERAPLPAQLLIKPERTIIRVYETQDKSLETFRSARTIEGYSLMTLAGEKGAEVKAIYSSVGNEMIALNKQNSKEMNHLFMGLLMTQYYYSQIISSFRSDLKHH